MVLIRRAPVDRSLCCRNSRALRVAGRGRRRHPLRAATAPAPTVTASVPS